MLLKKFFLIKKNKINIRFFNSTFLISIYLKKTGCSLKSYLINKFKIVFNLLGKYFLNKYIFLLNSCSR